MLRVKMTFTEYPGRQHASKVTLLNPLAFWFQLCDTPDSNPFSTHAHTQPPNTPTHPPALLARATARIAFMAAVGVTTSSNTAIEIMLSLSRRPRGDASWSVPSTGNTSCRGQEWVKGREGGRESVLVRQSALVLEQTE